MEIDSPKAGFRGKCVTLKAYIRKKGKPISKFPCQKQIKHGVERKQK